MPSRPSPACSAVLALLTASAFAAAGEAPATLHPASAMVRVGGTEGVLPAHALQWRVDCVRGEREGCQCAFQSEATVRRVELRAARDDAPSSALFQVLAVPHAAPPAEGMFVVPPRRLGAIPDVLLPFAGREAMPVHTDNGIPLTVYAEFHCPIDTQPGDYGYELLFETEAGTETLAVTLRVHSPALPARLPFRSAVCWNWSLEKYYGRPLTRDEKKVFWAFCLDYRLSPCSFFSKLPDPPPEELAALNPRRLSLVCLMQVSGRKARAFDQQKQEKYAPLLKLWRAELEKAGLLSDAVVLLADEPAPGEEAIHIENAKWLKEQFPELKIWLASKPSEAWAKTVDVFDVVTAHSTDLYKDHCHDAGALAWWRKAKPFPRGEYWWFHSVEPYAPYTNVRLDNLPIEGRVSGWQSAAAGVDGYEYFWIADWSANLESKAASWPARAKDWKTGLSGAGTLCYPDEQMRPMPSLRLVNLRDGLEDWALLEQLIPRTDLERRRELVAPVSKSLQEFTTDPEVLLKTRLSVLELLKKKIAP